MGQKTLGGYRLVFNKCKTAMYTISDSCICMFYAVKYILCFSESITSNLNLLVSSSTYLFVNLHLHKLSTAAFVSRSTQSAQCLQLISVLVSASLKLDFPFFGFNDN